MGWDVMILNSKETSTISQVDASSLPSFGKRDALIGKLNELFPKLEWDDDLAYGHLDNEEYFGNIGVGEDEKMAGYFYLGIYGGTNPLKLIITLCNEFNCSAFDTVTSEYITADKFSDKGWKHFQEFSNYVIKHISNTDEDKTLSK